MRTYAFLRHAAAGAVMLAAVAGAQTTGGKFYGLFWDGSAEHFVTVDPFTGQHASLGTLPGVKYVDATFRLFDPDSSRFVFVGGGSTGAMSYFVVDAATGYVSGTAPRNDNLKNPVYDPGTGLVYGTWWSDSTVQELDSLGRPLPRKPRGTEYFAAIHPVTGARSDTPIPGLWTIAAGSQFFDPDNGRYVFQGKDTLNVSSYYVIDAATGEVAARIPLEDALDFPVYNPVIGAVHGLWWSDSTVRELDSLGRPKPTLPHQIHGTEYFVTLSLSDSSVTIVPLPGVKYISNLNRALDVDSQRYVFTGKEETGPMRYYVVDVATGALLSNTEAAGNVIHLAYAPLKSTVYPVAKYTSLRGRAEASWTLRAAPSAGAFTLEFANPRGEALVFTLRDAGGRAALRRDGVTGNSLRVETRGLKAGVYIFRLSGGAGTVAAGKLVVK